VISVSLSMLEFAGKVGGVDDVGFDFLASLFKGAPYGYLEVFLVTVSMRCSIDHHRSVRNLAVDVDLVHVGGEGSRDFGDDLAVRDPVVVFFESIDLGANKGFSAGGDVAESNGVRCLHGRDSEMRMIVTFSCFLYFFREILFACKTLQCAIFLTSIHVKSEARSKSHTIDEERFPHFS
jgi:hypothetical protein